MDAFDLDAIVVGAGFAGLYMLRRLREQGLRARLLEAGDQVGGTWFWNRYPGARCDFESHDYSYGFDDRLQQEWTWTERYPGQPEILRYLNHVADRFGLRADITLRARVTTAHYDEDGRRWTVQTDDGTVASARFLIMATGALSAPRVPDFPGLDSFRGRRFHTAAWPGEAVDFTGRRVAVIGTGSSGVQVITEIAPRAAHLYVMQRTAGFVIPSWNRPLTDTEVRAVKDDYPAFRDRARETFLGVYSRASAGPSALAVPEAERTAEYEKAWSAGLGLLGIYGDLIIDQAANDTLADFIRAKIAEIVTDPRTARLLSPRGYPVGPRTETAAYDVDDIVFATGFDALTGPLLAIDIRGAGGRVLADEWSAGPATYLGLAVSGFPNLFPIAGPGGPGVLTNVVRTIEHDVDWITGLLGYMGDHGYATAEAGPGEQRAWGERVAAVAGATLFPRANSWYLGANIPGKPRVFMPYAGGLPGYRQICQDIADHGYRGFAFAR